MINVLIVDDSERKSQKIKGAIVSEEVDFCHVSTVSEACNSLQEKQFDLMVLDLNLPMRKDSEPVPDAGVKFLEQLLRRQNFKKPIHIIGLTAFGELLDEYREKFHKRGWLLLRYEESSTKWEEVIQEKVCHIANTSKIRHKMSSWSGLHYLIIFIVILIVLAVIFYLLDMKGFCVVSVIAILTFIAVCLVQLRNDDKLSDMGFRSLVCHLLEKLPYPRKNTKETEVE